MSSELRASSTDFAAKYRCTWLWSVPKYDNIKNVPPITPDQNVYVFVRLNEKSNTRNRPVAPAMCNASLGDTGICTSNVTVTATIAVTISIICLTSTHVTAWTPPIIVYNTAGTPMIATDQPMLQPKIAENTTAGAEMIVPHDIARETRNKKAVSDRVFASNRRSRNSYAVYTPDPCKNGTSVTPRITIASGSPK